MKENSSKSPQILELVPRQDALDILYQIVLPGLENRTSRLIPAPEIEGEKDAGFHAIFPYDVDSHGVFELVWQVDNWMHINVEERVYRMNAGDFCLLAPGVLHAEVCSPVTPPHRSLWCVYRDNPALFCVQIYNYDSYKHGQIVLWVPVPAPPLAGTLLLALQSEMQQGKPRSAEVCYSILGLLVQLIIRALETEESIPDRGSDSNRISNEVIEYLRRHFADDVLLKDVARATSLSPNYLATVFKQTTGKTVGKALTEIRIHEAKVLLLEGKHSIRHIAHAVGYRSPEHFCRVFQRSENVAPSLYCK